MVEKWFAALSIAGLLVMAIYNLVKVVIQLYSLLEEIKKSCLASDQLLDERIDQLEYDLAGLKRDFRDIRGVVRRFIPNSFTRVSDHEADRPKDSDSE